MATVAPTTNVNKLVKTEIYAALRDSLVKPISKTSTTSWAQSFIEQMLTEAKKNPNGPLGQLIARQIMQDDILTSLDDSTNRYLARDIDFNEYRLYKTLYDNQQAVFSALPYKKRVAAICSRRVGKTELAARLLLKDALQPNHHALYVALRFDSAIRQCYVLVEKIINDLGLPVTSMSKSDGVITFPNGSDITFMGNANKAMADTKLGFKFSLAILDEVQSQCQPKYMIDTVLSPALKDYDGCLVLLGTPPRVPHTYIEEVWNNYKGWNKYKWTMFDNPFIKNVDEYLDNLCIERNISRDTPFIQREYYGVMGAYDKEAQLMKDALIFDRATLEQEIDKGNIKIDRVYGGVDFGFSDYNAIVTLGWDKKNKKGYIIDCFKFNQATVTEIIEKAKISLANAQEILIKSHSDPHNIMYYGDNSDKSIIFELSVNYNFPIQCAYKHNKMEALSALAEMARRFIYTPENSALTDEYEMTIYKRDEETDAILPELDDDIYHPDAIMAMLYASRSLVLDENPLGKEDGADIEDYKPLPKPEEDESYIRPQTNNIETERIM